MEEVGLEFVYGGDMKGFGDGYLVFWMLGLGVGLERG